MSVLNQDRRSVVASGSSRPETGPQSFQ